MVNPFRGMARCRAAQIARALPGANGRSDTVAQYEGYCVKCREKRTFEGQVVELKNGRKAAQGACPVCSTKMNRILGKNA